MPVAVRERVFQALFDVISGVDGFAFVGRDTAYELATSGEVETPAAILYEGRETPTNLQSGVSTIETEAVVLVVGRGSSMDTIGTELNGMIAVLKQAVLADPTLGGGLGVSDIEWRATEPPSPDGDPGAPPYGSMQLTFALQRQEAERDPFITA